jgi:hypothetical protein
LLKKSNRKEAKIINKNGIENTSHMQLNIPPHLLHQFPMTVDPCLDFLLLISRGTGKTQADCCSKAYVVRPRLRHKDTWRYKTQPEVGVASQTQSSKKGSEQHKLKWK